MHSATSLLRAIRPGTRRTPGYEPPPLQGSKPKGAQDAGSPGSGSPTESRNLRGLFFDNLTSVCKAGRTRR